MSKALVLFWLGTSASQASHQVELNSWARARWVKLTAPAVPAGITYDEAVVATIEAELDQARLAASSLDDATASERLAAIDRSLHAHPALPQAAWLMAEALQIEASVAARTAPEKRARLLARAAVLEGPRAPAFGEVAEAKDASPTLTISAGAARAADEVYFDGERISDKREAVAGEHHVRLVRRQRVIWAGWVRVESSGPLALPLPTPLACSVDELEGTSISAGKVSTPPGVACARWAVARPASGGGIEIASCAGSSCGPLMRWQRHYGAVYTGPPQPPPEPGFPAWATWALVGVGAAVVTTGVLWQAGAFDEPKPGATRFEFYGPGAAQNAFSSSARGRR